MLSQKGCLSNKAALATAFKLVEGPQGSWRRLDDCPQLPKWILGVKFSDALEITARLIIELKIAAASPVSSLPRFGDGFSKGTTAI